MIENAYFNNEAEVIKLDKLIDTFNNLFSESHNTILISGDDEPIYLPASEENKSNRIVFANNFFSSALHEISHWLVAGSKRRQLEDYGYWYKPDGRSELEQIEFEKVEIKPQALEWLLSSACGHTFNFSADNLNGGTSVSDEFKHKVCLQVLHYLDESRSNPDGRLSMLLSKLTRTFNQPYPLKECFKI